MIRYLKKCLLLRHFTLFNHKHNYVAKHFYKTNNRGLLTVARSSKHTLVIANEVK